LHRALGIAITACYVAQRKLRQIAGGIQNGGELFARDNLLFSAGGEARFVFRCQDLPAPQIVFGVNVILLLRLLFARALLARRFRGTLRLLGAALGSAKKQAGAEKDGEAAAKRPPQRHRCMHTMLAATGEVSARHFPTHFERNFDGKILLKIGLCDNGIL
jgi:hypothetical protein